MARSPLYDRVAVLPQLTKWLFATTCKIALCRRTSDTPSLSSSEPMRPQSWVLSNRLTPRMVSPRNIPFKQRLGRESCQSCRAFSVSCCRFAPRYRSGCAPRVSSIPLTATHRHRHSCGWSDSGHRMQGWRRRFHGRRSANKLRNTLSISVIFTRRVIIAVSFRCYGTRTCRHRAEATMAQNSWPPRAQWRMSWTSEVMVLSAG